MSRAAYLARYSQASHSHSDSGARKRKRPTASSASNIRIVDDSDTAWPQPHSTRVQRDSNVWNDGRHGDQPTSQPTAAEAEGDDVESDAARIQIQREDGSGWVEVASQQSLSLRKSTAVKSSWDEADQLADLSPPRQAKGALADLSPPRRRVRHDSPDLSPPRRLAPRIEPLFASSSAGGDLSPHRRRRYDSVSPIGEQHRDALKSTSTSD